MNIKFRVWDNQLKLFTHDSIYPLNQTFVEEFFIDQRGDLILLSTLAPDPRFEFNVWTGLTDIKNNKIFENDIIRIVRRSDNTVLDVGVVKFRESSFLYKNKHDAHYSLDETRVFTKLEVVGNVYENQLLCKEQ